MKQGDVTGLIILLGVFALGIGGIIALRTMAKPEPFAPVEVPGSALVFISATEEEILADVVMGGQGFVTVHETLGGAPGPVMGVSSILFEGIHSAVRVVPDGALSGEKNYTLLLMEDSNNNERYDAGIDRPVMVDGKVIRVPVAL